jgi:hypothetical protein
LTNGCISAEMTKIASSKMAYLIRRLSHNSKLAMEGEVKAVLGARQLRGSIHLIAPFQTSKFIKYYTAKKNRGL